MTSKPQEIVRVLIVDDDQDDYFLTSDFLSDSIYAEMKVDWCSTYENGLAEIRKMLHDVYLIDFHLGEKNGLELMQEAISSGVNRPFILLTGQGDRDIDRQAMELGATDFIVKGQFNSQTIERSILYALRQAKVMNELRVSEQRYRAVVESQSELICRFLPDTTLTFVNEAYCQYFGISSEEYLGQSFLRLIPESDHQHVLNNIQAILQNKEPVTYEHEVIHPQLESSWQQWTDQPIFDEQGQIIEVQSVGIDITNRKKGEIALRSMLERERELGDLKSRFVSMASHEFRTPLTTILSSASYLELAGDRISPEKGRNKLQKIQQATRNMTQLLDDVLIFAKGDANRLRFKPETVDLIAFLTELSEDIQAGMGRTHQIVFDHDIDQLVCFLDTKLLRQMFTNLLSNGIKYSPAADKLWLSCHLVEESPLAEGRVIKIVVRDEGIGIPEKDQVHLFEPFHRATNVRDFSGTGLGLAITQKAAELHGGIVEFESEVGRGSQFTIYLPLIENLERISK